MDKFKFDTYWLRTLWVIMVDLICIISDRLYTIWTIKYPIDKAIQDTFLEKKKKKRKKKRG